ncbi:NAD(P)-dependent alcohol dehydrogenase [Candidatus Kapabacteria bacterium]|nr:NAD(P)-dependent alcohol dehydrogenase [Candidatus Kapabacteria bacterium]
MKAVTANQYGSPEIINTVEVPKPIINKNEILIEVKSSAITTADTMIRAGKPKFGRLFLGISKPKKSVLGTGFAGVISEIGSEVSNWKVGDKVFGETSTDFGANAQFLKIDKDATMLEMINDDYATHSVMCDGTLTSYNFLHNIIKLKNTDKILINGGSGSLGVAAIQLAKIVGCEVTAVCSDKNIEFVKKLGADKVINYKEVDFTKLNHKFNYIFDTVGKSSFSRCKDILENDGKYLTPVLNLNMIPQLLLNIFRKKKLVFSATGLLKPKELKSFLNEILHLIKTNKLTIPLTNQYNYSNIIDAHKYIETGRKVANIYLVN